MALSHFSHYQNSTAATKMWEVVSPALFEVWFRFPDIMSQYTKHTFVGEKDSVTYLFEHVRSISGLDGLTPTVGNVVQKFKFAERHYAAAGPDKTSLELTVTFTLNLNDSHQNYIYNMLRAWYNLIYNPQNGRMLTKKQYAENSYMDIYEFDRDGAIWRHVKCFNFFPSTPPTGLNEDNYDSVSDAKTVSMTFIVDDWTEEITGMSNYKDPSSGAITGYDTDLAPLTDGDLGNIYQMTGSDIVQKPNAQ
jgi:hypothetical protein